MIIKKYFGHFIDICFVVSITGTIFSLFLCLIAQGPADQKLFLQMVNYSAVGLIFSVSCFITYVIIGCIDKLDEKNSEEYENNG